MQRDDQYEDGPVSVLEDMIDGGLTPGEVGVVMARPGVGKTAFLVQIGIDSALRDHKVLHVAVDQDVDHIRSWYDTLFDDLAAATDLSDRVEARVRLERNRMIQSYTADLLTVGKLSGVLSILEEHADFRPELLVIDGFPWTTATPATLLAWAELASARGAALWTSSRITDPDEGRSPEGIPAPVGPLAEGVRAVLFLRPGKNHVDLRVLKGHGGAGPHSTPLTLHPDTMRLVDHRETGSYSPVVRKRSEYTIYSGAAPGAEATFGEFAQRYGLAEVNYTYEGHTPARERGLTPLSERKLRQGDVSLSYVAKRMNRTFTTSPTFRRVLQCIWHQVNQAQQVIVVGLIKDDGTVKGGTGWGAELARVWSKPLWVFDQEKEQWFRWNVLEEKWVPSRTPRLIATNVAGTGTRFLTDAGREAIASVFATSFGESEE